MGRSISVELVRVLRSFLLLIEILKIMFGDRKDLRYSVRSKPIIADGIVYVSNYHDLIAFNSENGTVNWKYEDIGEG